MAKGNLALLDRAVQGAVGLELGDGEHDHTALAELGVSPQRRRSIAGLEVVSNTARDAEVDPISGERMDKLLRYRTDRSLVMQKLERVGVKPLAVLPLTAWEFICNESGLFRFLPEGDRVRLGTDGGNIVELAWDRARDEARAKMKEPYPMQGILQFLSAMVAIGSFFAGYYFESWWLVGGMLVTGSVMFSFCAPDTMPDDAILKPAAARHMRALIQEWSEDGSLAKHLWPDFHEMAKGVQVRILLPDPPQEVQEILVAAERARLPMHIAVVGDAIAFKENPADALLKAHEQWKAEQRKLQQDPIAYVIEGTAVAIVSQFGDFPVERAVVSRVINSEHLV